jgi:pyrroloquinoline-quinone synthase
MVKTKATERRVVNKMDVELRLTKATADDRLLDHPFYQSWAAGTLEREDLGFYAGQYWRQVEAFPDYLRAAAARMAPGAPRETVEANLRDEVDDDHAGLWLRFAESLGRKENEIRTAPPEPETAECVSRFSTAAESASAPFFLGMLYGYESQTPEVAKTKVEGLRDHYGIVGRAAEYFELHGDLDVEHSAELAGAIAQLCESEEELSDAEEGARAGARAIYGLLDGVARVRGIA